MEEFLGVLFCGGRGERLGELTRYISKSFIPVYDTPVFKFGLSRLENSTLIKEIIILTNAFNDKALRKIGHRTILQDDSKVSDMFTGWEYIKKKTGTKKNGVLVPSDNVCGIKIDQLIKDFLRHDSKFFFSLKENVGIKKLGTMGSYDVSRGKYSYKNKKCRSTDCGVIAPYIVHNSVSSFIDIFESKSSHYRLHKGYWFDLGDYDSIVEAGEWRRKNKSKKI